MGRNGWYCLRGISKAFEVNEITLIIREILKRIKGKENSEKKNVLIIDDFDRLDPDHVFRILNILSVHNDTWDADNKFGFDKIIIVCDVDRLEKLFRHKYGVDADFEGYIDKFCSTHFYKFSIEDEIRSYLYANVLPKSMTYSNHEEITVQLYLLTAVISYFLTKQKITMRKLLKVNFKYTIPSKKLLSFKLSPHKYQLPHAKVDDFYINYEDLPFLQTLKLLSMIWGDWSLLLKDLRSAANDSGNLNKHFDTEQIQGIGSALALAFHIATVSEEISLVAKGSKNSVGRMVWDYPEINLPYMKFRLSSHYAAGAPYLGKESYYSKAKILPLESNTELITFQMLFSSVNETITGLRNKGYLKVLDFV